MKLSFRFGFGSKETLTLLRNLSVTLKAGVSLTQALKLFEDDARSARKRVITHLRKTVEAGHPLSDALETAPFRFPELVINLVKIGELGGTLEESLEEAVHHIQKSVALRRKVRSAMMYPTFVFVAIIGLGLSIGIFVLPQLIPLFDSLDVTLPLSTRILLWLAVFFETEGVRTAVILAIALGSIYGITRFEFAKYPFHRLLLMIPYFREVQRKTAVAQMANTMSILLSSGIPIHEAIISTISAVENRVFRRGLEEAYPVVEKGRPLSKGMEHAGVFPHMTVALVEIGEETGTLSESLSYLSEYYEEEVDYAVKNLTTALEPLLLIFIGLLVGGTVLAIITPIYDVTGSIR